MIITKTENGVTAFTDESAALPAETLQAVQAAMRAGWMEFTTPTPDDNDQRINWKVRRWVTANDGEPAAFLVAYQELSPHFEVLGPPVELEKKSKK